MKLGANPTPPHVLAKVPFLHDYLEPVALPLVPDQTKYSAGMHGAWGDLGNIKYGCCIFAGYGHYKQCTSSNATGTPEVVTTDQVLGWYSDVTGFNKDDPSTDNGANAVEALDYLVRIREIAAYARVNLFDSASVARGHNLFGGLYTILYMPLAWQRTTTWGVGPNQSGIWAPNSWGGHCVYSPDYDSSMNLTGVSWGDPDYIITPEGADVYMPEAFVIVSHHWVNTMGQTIQGFKLDELQKALALVM
jgi:hypothetical protein